MKYSTYVKQVHDMIGMNQHCMQMWFDDLCNEAKKDTVSSVLRIVDQLQASAPEAYLANAKYVIGMLDVPESFVEQSAFKGARRIYQEWKQKNGVK